MAFAAPWMLVGLIGLAVPIVIHLIDRSRSAPLDWPTLRFRLKYEEPNDDFRGVARAEQGVMTDQVVAAHDKLAV